MTSPYNSCGSSSKDDALLVFDSPIVLHSFHRRDLSVATASSFIVVVTVAFVVLIVIFAGTCSYYRRRYALEAALEDNGASSTKRAMVRPRLWEVSVRGSRNQTVAFAKDWRHIIPLAVRLSSDRPVVDTVEVEQHHPKPGLSDWLHGGSRSSTSHQQSDEAEVAVLVSLPYEPITTTSSTSRAPDCENTGATSGMTARRLATSEHSWVRYSVGVAQVPYVGDEESTVS